MKKNRRPLQRSTVITIVVVALVILSICIIIPTIAIMSIDCDKKAKTADFNEQTLLDYFNITDGIDIVWAHATNSQHDLSVALNDLMIMMLETDVMMDPINHVPIMAHPPATTSDITLKDWLHQVYSANKKGIKLDFKQVGVIPVSLIILQDILKKNIGINLPILLNADILPGPNNNIMKPVNAGVFIKSCSNVENVILSPGWTTGFNGNSSSGYTWDHVKEMYEIVKDLKQHVTFPVRASLISKSRPQLLWLLGRSVERFSLTVWTSKKDSYKVEELHFLRKFKKQVYYDLPESEILLLKS